MRRLFSGRHRSPVYPKRSCHFCCVESWIVPPHPTQIDNDAGDVMTTTTTTSTNISSSSSTLISTGSVSNWFCCSCQCWNRADSSQIGGIATWEQRMSDGKQNIDSLRRRATPVSALSRTSFPVVSPFCHSCQTNQTLILSILANGDTDDVDEGAIQQWQASLESRYPPVCSQCQEMVSDRIESADKLARRLIWNGWLSKSRERGVVSPQRGRASIKSVGPSYEDGADTMWSVTGFIWVVQSVAFLVGASIGFSTVWGRSELGSKEQWWYGGALLLSHLFTLSWDPTLPQQLQLKRRFSPGSTIRVEGWSKLQQIKYWLLCIRFLDLLLPTDLLGSLNNTSLLHLSSVISLLAILVQCSLTAIALGSLRIVTPHSISLKSRAAPSDSPVKVNGHSATEEPPLNLLSLDSTTKQPEVDLAESTESTRAEQEVEMDWSPTPDRKSFDFQLGPQRFFEPIRKTGLEDLLHTHLALDEGRRMQRVEGAAARKQPRRSAIMVWCAVTALTFLVSLAAITLAPSQVKAALRQTTRNVMEQSKAWREQIRRLLDKNFVR